MSQTDEAFLFLAEVHELLQPLQECKINVLLSTSCVTITSYSSGLKGTLTEHIS